MSDTGENAQIPTIHFDSESLEAGQRYDAWQENLGVLFDMTPPDGGNSPKDFRASIDACNLGGVIFGVTRAQTQMFRRNSRRVARDDMDHLLVQVFLKGGGVANSDHRINAGDMLVIDLDQPHQMLNTDFANLTMVLPRDLIGGVSQFLAPLHGQRLGAENPMVRFMSDHLISLWRHVPDMRLDQAGGALQGTIGLMENWLATDKPLTYDSAPSVSAAIGKSICRYIDLHLAEPMTPETLAREFRVSRSQIYRMFAPTGGVARYILERRLRRCLRMLTQQLFNRLSIGAIGFACGLSSESHFSRSFRSRYGLSPSEARAAAFDLNRIGEAENDGTRSGMPPFAAWIRQLSD